MAINEERMERRRDYLRAFVQSAWTSELAEVDALAEQLRVELMIGRSDAALKAFYRAAARYLETAAKQRRGTEGGDRVSARRVVADYLKLFTEGLRS
jgi:hypothetical protein